MTRKLWTWTTESKAFWTRISDVAGRTLNPYDEQHILERKLANIQTNRERRDNSLYGIPDLCQVFTLHKIITVTPADKCTQIGDGCILGGLGCSGCKLLLAKRLVEIAKQ